MNGKKAKKIRRKARFLAPDGQTNKYFVFLGTVGLDPRSPRAIARKLKSNGP